MAYYFDDVYVPYRIAKSKTNKVTSVDNYTCKKCGSSQISIEEGNSYICFECGYRTGKDYKVGDRVKVRNDLRTGRCGSNAVVSEMLVFKGKIVTIEAIHSNGEYLIDGCHWNWTNEMFEGIAYD